MLWLEVTEIIPNSLTVDKRDAISGTVTYPQDPPVGWWKNRAKPMLMTASPILSSPRHPPSCCLPGSPDATTWLGFLKKWAPSLWMCQSSTWMATCPGCSQELSVGGRMLEWIISQTAFKSVLLQFEF